jgi:hypothetical protein
MRLRVMRGPFRGGVVYLNPRDSLRKLMGLYEAELNPWLEGVLPQVDTILDVGANDGYFCFGCAAALRRMGRSGRIVAFEPLPGHQQQLRTAAELQPDRSVPIEIVDKLVGSRETEDMVTLDSAGGAESSMGALVKIDVEGAEEDVLAGAGRWLTGRNHFVIEVHERRFLETIPSTFEARGMRVRQINQAPAAWLRREQRSVDNWWIVTEPAE